MTCFAKNSTLYCVAVAILLLLIPGSLSAGTLFTAVQFYDSGWQAASSVAIADMNGDGKPDLVIANYCADTDPLNCDSGSVAVLLGNGDGTFQAPISYATTYYFNTSVAVADVNGDGKPDVLVLNGGSVGVFLGNGDGTLQSAVWYSSDVLSPYPGGSTSLAVADLKGDGKLDLMVAGALCTPLCTNGAVSVLLGKGDGTFQAAVSYETGGEFGLSIAVGDLNGDGKPDLVVTNGESDTVGVLLGNGDGTFQPAVTYNAGQR